MTRILLFVVNVDWFFLSHRLPIALEAQQQGYQVHIATGLTDKSAVLQEYGFVVHQLKLDRSSASLRSIWLMTAQLLRVFKAVRPDIVHLVTIKPILLGGLAARLVGIPAVVVAVSGLGYVFSAKGLKAVVRRWLVGFLYRFILAHPNLIVVFQNSDDFNCLAQLAYLPESKIAMIRGSGVDLSIYKHTQLPRTVPVVLLAARMLADKGVKEFVQAARLLIQQGIGARFCLVGGVDPANPASLTDVELTKWANEGVVEFWGHRSNMPHVLSIAYLVALPSYYGEGLPKVLIEAAACGRPVVTTNHPGCRDAIDPDVTGVLVPVRNAVALAEVIKELLSDPKRCQVMGNAGRALAEREFDVQQVVATHLRLYQELQKKT